MKTGTNRILTYTLIAMIVIATYITIASYYTQLSIYEEKEIFKLDCIANAVAYKIRGEDHSTLIKKYPDPGLGEEVQTDSVYLKIRKQLAMAKKMTGVPSEMHTVIRDSADSKYRFAIATEDRKWLDELDAPHAVDTLYPKGGMIGRFTDENGVAVIGALSPIRNANNEIVGMLQVNETFESFITKSRNQIYFNILLTLIFILVIGTLMFFSVRSILARQQKLALEKMEVEKLRRELLANVSHDIRTPLASIHGYVETLLMKKNSLSPDQVDKYLNTTLQGTEKLKSMVDELFELSMLESRERKPQMARFDIRNLLNDVSAGFRVEATRRGIELKTAIPGAPLTVTADVAMIDRVLHNLLSNAMKYCESGDVITLTAKEENGKVEISVTDSGAGISAEDLPHIFDRFHKGKTTVPGTGLGLAIVRNILELHNTTCRVESEKGKGSAFHFSL